MDGNGPAAMMQVVIQSDGVKVHTNGNVPLDVMEGLLARALSNVGREILIARLLQTEALREQAKPRVTLSGGPMI